MIEYPKTYPKDILDTVGKALMGLKSMAEKMTEELERMTRYSTVAQLQRESLEEQMDDMKDDMQLLREKIRQLEKGRRVQRKDHSVTQEKGESL